MEVYFTPEQEARLSQIAKRRGTDAQQLVKNAALRLIEEDTDFRASVRRGMEQANSGDLIGHADVKARIDRLLGR